METEQVLSHKKKKKGIGIRLSLISFIDFSFCFSGYYLKINVSEQVLMVILD